MKRLLQSLAILIGVGGGTCSATLATLNLQSALYEAAERNTIKRTQSQIVVNSIVANWR